MTIVRLHVIKSKIHIQPLTHTHTNKYRYSSSISKIKAKSLQRRTHPHQLHHPLTQHDAHVTIQFSP